MQQRSALDGMPKLSVPNPCPFHGRTRFRSPVFRGKGERHGEGQGTGAVLVPVLFLGVGILWPKKCLKKFVYFPPDLDAVFIKCSHYVHFSTTRTKSRVDNGHGKRPIRLTRELETARVRVARGRGPARGALLNTI